MPLQTAHPLLDEDDLDELGPFAGPRTRGGAPKRRRRRTTRQGRREAELVPLDPEARSSPWGPMIPLGSHLRLQAHRGYRGAVVELEPGLYLVAEVPNETLRSEFGVVPLLASLLTATAARSLQRRSAAPPPAPVVAPAPWMPAPQLPWAPDPEPTALLAGFGPRTCACGRRH